MLRSSPLLVWMSRRWLMKSKRTSKASCPVSGLRSSAGAFGIAPDSADRGPKGMIEVVRPRGVTYSVTFHQWFTSGVSAARVFPTICVHMCSVSQVLSHSENGSGGQSGEVKFDLIDIAPAPIFARLE